MSLFSEEKANDSGYYSEDITLIDEEKYFEDADNDEATLRQHVEV